MVKKLTMTTFPLNFPHGQWSNNMTMATISYFLVTNGQKTRPWPQIPRNFALRQWSKIFDHVRVHDTLKFSQWLKNLTMATDP